MSAPVSWRAVRCLLDRNSTVCVASETNLLLVKNGQTQSLDLPRGFRLASAAITDKGRLVVAGRTGLLEWRNNAWSRVIAVDQVDRRWTARDVACVGFDGAQRLWFGAQASVGCRQAQAGESHPTKSQPPGR